MDKWIGQFSKEEVQFSNKSLKKCSKSLVIKVKCKSKLHQDFISPQSECWCGHGGKQSLIYCWWESKLVQPLWKLLWRSLVKLKIELLYDPAIALLRIYLKECKPAFNRGTCTPVFICVIHEVNSSTITIAKL
jgi:hypothetical protein